MPFFYTGILIEKVDLLSFFFMIEMSEKNSKSTIRVSIESRFFNETQQGITATLSIGDHL